MPHGSYGRPVNILSLHYLIIFILNLMCTQGAEYLYLEDWGESLVGKSSPVVVVCDLNEEEVKVVEVGEGVGEEELSLGQAVWAPGGGIVGVAWETAPRRLGLVYCTNRISWIFHISPDGTFS
jgi:acylaminoacyl-peptidase